MQDNLDKIIKERKDRQRKAGIAARKALGGETAARYSEIIVNRLLAHPAFAGTRFLFSYQPFAGEADITAFNARAEAAGKTVAYPVCKSQGIMYAAVPEDASAWTVDRYGIRSPAEALSRVVAPGDFALVLVPCTAFDGKNRTRIGYGAGYYDRYLPQCANAVFIAVAYEIQRTEPIAFDRWDVPMDAIVTEEGWY
ncbi:MAG: 5-formyltetrahydrofolate cyclo-ligase [Clostridiales Family XIII bacterium]|jgi:5-formyltetrahydrofolate cyclo-ligase|nr:5-formyltetrahydrofolate cyclo-ligase [Clostridiales Family XIII bacterium]